MQRRCHPFDSTRLLRAASPNRCSGVNEQQQAFSVVRHIVDKVFAQRTHELANRPQWCGSLALLYFIRSFASRSCALLVTHSCATCHSHREVQGHPACLNIRGVLNSTDLVESRLNLSGLETLGHRPSIQVNAPQ